jgi:transcriptional regulator with PAS, ATPase and Fis domain
MRLHFHSRVGHIGTLMEGILAISHDGRIVGANRSALDQLGLSGAALRMQSLVSLFGTTVGALVDRFRSPLATPLEVHTDNGRNFHLHARFDWPVWSSVTEAAAAAAPLPPVDLADLVAAAGAPAAASRVIEQPGPGLAQLQTGDAHMDALVGKVRRVLDRDIPILVLGETGTGKELLARAIHTDSARARQPFVAVNCASIPDTLIEAELFGYEEGAFTGARRKGAIGKIQQAHGGTLFLDEIGDMPLPLQAHLLRVLQERQVTPLGSSRSVPVDVALICATHRNLREMIDAKAFREDLYYRLNGLAVKLPPLRERSDLAALVRRILEGEAGARPPRLSPEAQRLLDAYPWPGNVRQLFNVLRTAVVMAGGDPVIGCEHLPDDFVDEARRHLALAAPAAPAAPVHAPSKAPPAVSAAPPAVPAPAALPRSLEELELDAIRQAVAAAGGNISVAARQLGVSRNTIYRKLRWSQPDSA